MFRFWTDFGNRFTTWEVRFKEQGGMFLFIFPLASICFFKHHSISHLAMTKGLKILPFGISDLLVVVSYFLGAALPVSVYLGLVESRRNSDLRTVRFSFHRDVFVLEKF